MAAQMLWLFHLVMFVLFVGFSVPALSALQDSAWGAGALWGGLTTLVLGVEVLVAKKLPRLLGRDPYEDGGPDATDSD